MAASPKTVADSSQVLAETPSVASEKPESTAAPGVSQPGPAATAPATPESPDSVRFVRNILPNVDVTLPDGTKVPFRRYVFITSDKELIAKIKAVASQFHIVT